MRPVRQLFVIVAILGLWSPLRAQVNSPPPKGLRVFICAHSFHIFVADRLTPIATKDGIADHKLVDKQMIGGSRVIQHWDLPADKNKAKKALQAGNVDVFTMSPIPLMPDPGIDNFVDLGLKHNPDIRFLLQASWYPFDSLEQNAMVKQNAERDGKTIAELRPQSDAWRKAIEQQADALNKKHGKQAVFVVPVGDAVLKLRERVIAGKAPGIAKQSDLFTDPIGHAKLPVAGLTVYCHYCAIYKRKPTAFPPDVKTAEQENLFRMLQEIAWETVRDYDRSGVGKAAK